MPKCIKSHSLNHSISRVDTTNMINIKTILKSFFVISMFTTQTWLFVLPSIHKYLQGAIMVEVSTESSEYLHAPAATFCRLEDKRYYKVSDLTPESKKNAMILKWKPSL